MDGYIDALIYELKELSIPCTYEQAVLLCRHLELVIEKNKETNLTRIDTMQDGIFLHIIDSLICFSALDSISPGSHILDLGTGGGFPGIPLSIMLDADVTLLDSVRRKAAAVEDFILQLDLSSRCSVICARAEELAVTSADSFGIIVARAVAETNILIEYASPLLMMGGTLCAWKAHISEDELAAAERAAAICSMKIVSRETYELPHEYGHREIIYIRKEDEPSISLPRRNGMAAKRPLGR